YVQTQDAVPREREGADRGSLACTNEVGRIQGRIGGDHKGVRENGIQLGRHGERDEVLAGVLGPAGARQAQKGQRRYCTAKDAPMVAHFRSLPNSQIVVVRYVADGLSCRRLFPVRIRPARPDVRLLSAWRQLQEPVTDCPGGTWACSRARR